MGPAAISHAAREAGAQAIGAAREETSHAPAHPMAAQPAMSGAVFPPRDEARDQTTATRARNAGALTWKAPSVKRGPRTPKGSDSARSRRSRVSTVIEYHPSLMKPEGGNPA